MGKICVFGGRVIRCVLRGTGLGRICTDKKIKISIDLTQVCLNQNKITELIIKVSLLEENNLKLWSQLQKNHMRRFA